jgi:hypothetical protein
VSIVESTLETPWEYAKELLELCQSLLADTEDDTVEDNPGGEIERAYRWFGRVAADCEQLTVSWFGLGEAQTAGASALSGGRRHVYGRINMITFLVTVIRDCVPVLNESETGPPTIARSEASARELTRDAWALWTGIYRTMKDEGLFGGRCSSLWMIRCQPLEPMGELAGFELEIAAEIDGIPTSGS